MSMMDFDLVSAASFQKRCDLIFDEVKEYTHRHGLNLHMTGLTKSVLGCSKVSEYPSASHSCNEIVSGDELANLCTCRSSSWLSLFLLMRGTGSRGMTHALCAGSSNGGSPFCWPTMRAMMRSICAIYGWLRTMQMNA